MPSKKRPNSTAHRSPSRSGSKSVQGTQLLPPPPLVAAPAVPDLQAEWLETDGLGGFASGTVAGIRTRRTHALLLAHAGGRDLVLVNGLDARVTTPRGAFDLTSHRYHPDVVHPDGHRRIESFTTEPWPTWVYRLEDGTRIEHQLFTATGAAGVILTWSVVDGSAMNVHLMARPLISAREANALHHENPHFHAEAVCCDSAVQWRPYDGLPRILAGSNGSYAHHPCWYRNFLYDEDRARGLDHVEDLHSPGAFRFDLSRGEAVLVLTTAEGLRAMQSSAAARAAGLPGFVAPTTGDPEGALEALREGERASRAEFASPLHRAADAYVVRRGGTSAIVAGYPGADESPRETFAALRGLAIAGGRFEDAKRILVSWAPALSGGMFPARLSEACNEYDSVDAPLWFVIAARDLLAASGDGRRRITSADRTALGAAVETILSAYVDGTRHRIRMDEDGLITQGTPETRLTWMDAACPGTPPRIGKPVEAQALWLNALRSAGEASAPWSDLYERGRASFERRFWNDAGGCLYDLVDVGHERGTVDATMRPNQILAVGGLPYAILEGKRARQVVDQVEAQLFTPAGLRAGRADDETAPRLAWPWLLGPFIEAWVRVRGGDAEARAEARARFLPLLLTQLGGRGIGHLPEAVQPEPPFELRGAPFWARSVGEALRIDQAVLAS